MLITSLDNEKIKYLLKLKHKKYRDLYNEYLIEGEHLVKESYKNNVIKELIVLQDNPFTLENIPLTYVTKAIMQKLSDLDNYPIVIAVCRKNLSKDILGNKILLLDKIQDPGNLGTIIRSAKAFNIDTLILSLDTTDLYNSKVLRATQGIYNYLNIVKMDLEEAIKIIKQRNIPLYGTNVTTGVNVKTLKKQNSFYALIMGNEGQGVKPSLQKLCDKNIYIPMNKDVESLNVAIATSILLYEMNGEENE